MRAIDWRRAVRTAHRDQIPPLTRLERPELHVSDTDAFQADDRQADELAHAPDLALLAFAQDETQLIAVLPPHVCPLQDLAIEREPVIQKGETFPVR